MMDMASKMRHGLSRQFSVESMKKIAIYSFGRQNSLDPIRNNFRFTFGRQSSMDPIRRSPLEDDSSDGLRVPENLDYTMQLLFMASKGDVIAVQDLLDEGKDVNSIDLDGRTALHIASCEGHLEVVKLLLSWKANIDARDRWGSTAAADAKYYGNIEVYEFLKSCGAKVPKSKKTPMAVANPGEVPEYELNPLEIQIRKIDGISKGSYQVAKWNGTRVSVKILDKDSHAVPECIMYQLVRPAGSKGGRMTTTRSETEWEAFERLVIASRENVNKMQEAMNAMTGKLVSVNESLSEMRSLIEIIRQEEAYERPETEEQYVLEGVVESLESPAKEDRGGDCEGLLLAMRRSEILAVDDTDPVGQHLASMDLARSREEEELLLSTRTGKRQSEEERMGEAQVQERTTDLPPLHLGREEDVFGPVNTSIQAQQAKRQTMVITRGNGRIGGSLGEAWKMRNLLEEFYGDHGIRPPTIIGVREHVFTGNVSSSAYFMSSQESSFTFFEDFLSSPHLQIHRGNISVLRIIDPSEGCQISALIMEDRKRKIWIVQCLLLLSIGCLSQLRASDDVKFYESFDEKFEGRWVVSEKEDYNCVWKHSKSEGHDDYGFLVSDKAKKHAIVKVLEEPVELKDETVVLQFEVRLQEGLECGGAYIKYLRPQDAGWIPKNFDNESPYTIMFGPDKCGATNKVHFILKHENPKTGKYIEHHLKYPPSGPSDGFWMPINMLLTRMTIHIVVVCLRQISESQQQKDSGAAGWGKLREATLFALGSVSEQLLRTEATGPAMQNMLEQILIDDVATGVHVYPFLYTRLFTSVAKFSSVMNQQVTEHFLYAAIRTVGMDESPPVKVLALAFEGQGPLLLVAEDVESKALATRIQNKMSTGLKVCANKAPGFGENKKSGLQELVVLTRGQELTEELGLYLDEVNLDRLGSCKKVSISKDDIVILNGAGEKKDVEGSSKQSRSAFKHELTLLEKVRHPNVIQFVGAVTQNVPMMIVLECHSRGDLASYLRKQGRLSPSKVLRFALEIARGMNFLHECKPEPIVHCDLKPKNILLDSGGLLKVAGFGVIQLSTFSSNKVKLLQPDAIDRSNLYMAPEIYKDEIFDRSVDVHSFGLILYEMMEGTPLLVSKSPEEAAKLICLDEMRPTFKTKSKSFPPELRELIEECWHPDCVVRPTFSEIIVRLDKISVNCSKQGSWIDTFKLPWYACSLFHFLLLVHLYYYSPLYICSPKLKCELCQNC
ncbi:hypothetical protein F511_24793 [Dorcoceras hygrometricum]|uniref:non-specific serine/threonine protein kinase n=1 Tax=Dorcoceras hygrometricum TaxID=472368 RepID=A0A2Z7D647_9LAMI|nr:hypothetical protein F511_24793 [Dorcoceras hygrometricum]